MVDGEVRGTFPAARIHDLSLRRVYWGRAVEMQPHVRRRAVPAPLPESCPCLLVHRREDSFTEQLGGQID
jgi:hypothetical protein